MQGKANARKARRACQGKSKAGRSDAEGKRVMIGSFRSEGFGDIAM
jgi:hypothetical protein